VLFQFEGAFACQLVGGGADLEKPLDFNVLQNRQLVAADLDASDLEFF